jgi:hypothetical protein
MKKKLILGSEHDVALRGAVLEYLATIGAEMTARQFGLGGSQIIETTTLALGRDLLVVEAETYVGLSVSGPARLVNRVATLMAERTTKS